MSILIAHNPTARDLLATSEFQAMANSAQQMVSYNEKIVWPVLQNKQIKHSEWLQWCFHDE